MPRKINSLITDVTINANGDELTFTRHDGSTEVRTVPVPPSGGSYDYINVTGSNVIRFNSDANVISNTYESTGLTTNEVGKGLTYSRYPIETVGQQHALNDFYWSLNDRTETIFGIDGNTSIVETDEKDIVIRDITYDYDDDVYEHNTFPSSYTIPQNPISYTCFGFRTSYVYYDSGSTATVIKLGRMHFFTRVLEDDYLIISFTGNCSITGFSLTMSSSLHGLPLAVVGVYPPTVFIYLDLTQTGTITYDIHCGSTTTWSPTNAEVFDNLMSNYPIFNKWVDLRQTPEKVIIREQVYPGEGNILHSVIIPCEYRQFFTPRLIEEYRKERGFSLVYQDDTYVYINSSVCYECVCEDSGKAFHIESYDALGLVTYGRLIRVNYITGEVKEIHFPLLNQCVAVLSNTTEPLHDAYRRLRTVIPSHNDAWGNTFMNRTMPFFMDSINNRAIFSVKYNTFLVDMSKIENMTVTINGSEVPDGYYPTNDEIDGELIIYQSCNRVDSTIVGFSYTVKILPLPNRFGYNYYIISETDSGGVIINSAPHNSDYVASNPVSTPDGTVYYVVKFFDSSATEVAPTGCGEYSIDFSNSVYSYSATIHVQGSNDAGVSYGDSIIVGETAPNGSVQYTYSIVETKPNNGSYEFIDTITFYATDQNNITNSEVIVNNGDAIITTTSYAPDTAHCNTNLVSAYIDIIDIYGNTHTSNIFTLDESC